MQGCSGRGHSAAGELVRGRNSASETREVQPSGALGALHTCGFLSGAPCRVGVVMTVVLVAWRLFLGCQPCWARAQGG